MPLPIKSEHAEQVSFIHAAKKYLRANNKEYLIPVLFAIPNGGARDARTAGSLKMEGVRKGVPDVFFACARAGAHGLFIEMKKRKGGYLSKEQKEMMDILRDEGYVCEMAKGCEEAMDILKMYERGDV